MTSTTERWLSSCIGPADYKNAGVLSKMSDSYGTLLSSHLPSVHGPKSESEDPLAIDDPLSSARNSSEGAGDDR